MNKVPYLKIRIKLTYVLFFKVFDIVLIAVVCLSENNLILNALISETSNKKQILILNLYVSCKRLLNL